jgi:hypothetical protein
MKTGDRVVRVEFFGPFRAFGSEVEVPVASEVSFDELVSLLEERVGPGFADRAGKQNTTFILDRKIVPPHRLGEVRVGPGDRAAFGLLLGGG